MKNKIKSSSLICNEEIWSSEYLYNIKGSVFKNMKYIDVIKEKIRLGKELVKDISEELYSNKKMSYEDYVLLNERLKNVNKAIVHNELLLKDMEVKNEN